MATEFYFNELDPTNFQRLINAILVARYGEPVRLSPLRGRDGGRDAALAEPCELAFDLRSGLRAKGLPYESEGIAIFQVKHHRTVDGPILNARNAVVADFERELVNNILSRPENENVKSFFLVTSVPASRESIVKVDLKRKKLLTNHPTLHADVLWSEHVTAWLDQYPQIWSTFPDLFAGKVVPSVGAVAANADSRVARSFRQALTIQFRRDQVVRFRQVALEEKLTRLFVDLDLGLSETSDTEFPHIAMEMLHWERAGRIRTNQESATPDRALMARRRGTRLSCMHFFGRDAGLSPDFGGPGSLLSRVGLVKVNPH